jgi:hypothetical protein
MAKNHTIDRWTVINALRTAAQSCRDGATQFDVESHVRKGLVEAVDRYSTLADEIEEIDGPVEFTD